jgi:hypothetical protein
MRELTPRGMDWGCLPIYRRGRGQETSIESSRVSRRSLVPPPRCVGSIRHSARSSLASFTRSAFGATRHSARSSLASFTRSAFGATRHSARSSLASFTRSAFGATRHSARSSLASFTRSTAALRRFHSPLRSVIVAYIIGPDLVLFCSVIVAYIIGRDLVPFGSVVANTFAYFYV